MFRRLVEESGTHVSRSNQSIFGCALAKWIEQAEQANVSVHTDSPPLHLFGLTSYPPIFLRFFQTLSNYREIYAYHFAFCEDTLDDLPRKRFQHSDEETSISLPFNHSADHFAVPDEDEIGHKQHHPLLVSCAHSGARFQSLLIELGVPIGGTTPADEYNGALSDLEGLQDSLLKNKKRPLPFHADGSLSVHSCHSRLREIQVLRQQLLQAFSAVKDLRPEEILVMAPDLSAYHHAIDAVFGESQQAYRDHQKDAQYTIPYSVADRPLTEEALSWQFVDKVLDFVLGRQELSSAIRLLDFEPIREHVGVEDEELATLQRVLFEAGVRWGVTEAQRAEYHLPDFSAYTWKYGVERLLDGAIYGDGESPSRAPYLVEQEIQIKVAAFVQILKPLFEMADTRKQKQTFQAWLDHLLQILHPMLADTRKGNEWLGMLSRQLKIIEAEASRAKITFSLFASIINERRPTISGGFGFLRNGVTFCQLQPARHIPARIICLLGFDEKQYPRMVREREMDLRPQQLKRAGPAPHERFWLPNAVDYLGDPKLKEDDRQLFLDCLLHARERIYISYVGKSPMDNTSIPPSVVVSELEAFLKRDPQMSGVALSQQIDRVNQVLVTHPLQEWSPANFNRPQPGPHEPPVPLHFETHQLPEKRNEKCPFLSNPGESAKKWNALLRATDPLSTILDSADPNSAQPNRIELSDLIRFFKNPAHDYLEHSLRIRVDDLKWETTYEDDLIEGPDSYNPLAKWKLRESLWNRWLNGQRRGPNQVSEQTIKQKMQRALEIPQGVAGDALWDQQGAPEFLHALNATFEAEEMRFEACSLSIEGRTIGHECLTTSNGQQVIFINGNLRNEREQTSHKYRLEVALKHLLGQRESIVFTAKDHQCYVLPSMNAPLDQSATTHEQDNYDQWLRFLLACYFLGKSEPMPFPIGLAGDYMNQVNANQSSTSGEANLTHEQATAWYDKLTTAYMGVGEMKDMAFQFCFADDFPTNPDSPFFEPFTHLAERVLAPVLQVSHLAGLDPA